MNDCIETASGTQLSLTSPDKESIWASDIATALSRICRFAGHTKYFYSVAQHSVYAAKIGESLRYSKKTCLHLLLHDAAEAYICDVPRPLKKMLPKYQEIERQMMAVILERFGLKQSRVMASRVKEIDDVLLAWEVQHVMTSRGADWPELPSFDAYERHLPYLGVWTIELACVEWMSLFHNLIGPKRYVETWEPWEPSYVVEC